jgi:hypothetical protein
MCDYNLESKKALQALPVPLSRLASHLGPAAHRALIRAVRDGRARPNHDLLDGRPLPDGSLQRGHYMSPANFERFLTQLAETPGRCHWCGGRLPSYLAAQHRQPHNHRDSIQHHFHPRCWEARLLVIGAIFRHVQPDSLVGICRPKPRTAERGLRLVVKKVYRLLPLR